MRLIRTRDRTQHIIMLSILVVIALVVSTLIPLTSLAGEPDPSIFDAGSENRFGLTFTPDGGTAYWVEWNGKWGSRKNPKSAIYTAHKENGTWSKPEPAPFSRQYSDDFPFVSPDGLWLYFVSERPVSNSDEDPDADIWRYSLAEDNRLEHLSINSESAEFSPVVTSTGALYFASTRDGGFGQGDIYRAAPMEDGFAPAENLGPAINSHTGEWNLWVSADESELIFEASSRPGNVSVSGDLYYSWRTPAGWTAAVPIEPLNTGRSDLAPRIHPDGQTLYYTTAEIGGHARIAVANWALLSTQLRTTYAPTLLVANRSSHELTFVDLASAEIVTRIPTGEGPHLLSNVSDGRVLATGFGEFPQPHEEPVSLRPPFVESPNSRLTVIDTSNRTVLLDRVIEDCAKPHASWIVEQRAYVTCETEQRVLSLDLETGQAVDYFDTRQEGSHVLGFDVGSRTLAVANTESGSLTLIDIDSGDTKVVKLAGGSEGLLVTAGQVWVGNAWDGSVSVVDSRTATVVTQTESVCDFPISLSQRRQERVWIACFGSAELVSINTGTFTVEHRIKLDDQPLNLLLHPRLDLAYVSLPRQNAIAEIDLNSGREVRRINVGIEPDGLRWAAEEP